MTTAPLIITPEVTKALTNLKKLATESPVDVLSLMDRIKTREGERTHRAQMARQTYVVSTGPYLFWVTFSMETGHPSGMARHLSVSILRENRVPSFEAVEMIADIHGLYGHSRVLGRVVGRSSGRGPRGQCRAAFRSPSGRMKNLHTLDRYRRVDLERRVAGTGGGALAGIFEVPSVIDRQPLRIVASATDGWDHVSVSRRTRCPNWTEMEQIKRLFFEDHEMAMQLHVPVAEHLNCHPYCLHIWRPHDQAIPKPPAIFVAPSWAKST